MKHLGDEDAGIEGDIYKYLRERMKQMIDYGNGELKEARETVCVPVERYEKLILAERCMDAAALRIAEDWSVAADNGYLEPTELMKALLAVYNPGLYASTVSAVERIKADNRMRREAAKPNTGGTETPFPGRVQTDLF